MRTRSESTANHNKPDGMMSKMGASQRSEGPGERNDFFGSVWRVVADIPFGRVTTYGHIAEHLGARSAARTVGWAMRAARGSNLPCHRVVNRFGALSGARSFDGPNLMEDLLRSEGVTFDADGCVILDRHLWIPGRSGG